MNKEEATTLITETFKNNCSEGRFRNFINNLLPNAERKDDTYTGQVIPEAYRSHITSYKRIAKYIDGNDVKIDVLMVKISNIHKLDYARTMQRNFIAYYLGKRDKEAVLVAFYSDNHPDWRFSFVKMDYAFNKDGKVKQELTPAKRYSFLVGVNEGVHTPSTALLPLFQQEFRVKQIPN